MLKIKLSTFKKAAINWYNNDPFSQSAAISYYTIFSFPALAFIYLSLASMFADEENVQKQLTGYFEGIVGAADANNIQAIIEKTAPDYTNFWALAVGGGILFFAGLKLFLQLQKTLNMIWRVEIPKHVSIWSLVKQRLTAFSVMLGILFILITSLLVTTVIAAAGDFITENISEQLLVFISVVNFVISLCVISFLFTVLLKLLPDVHIRWKHAFAGGVFSALLFIIGQHLLGIYFKMAEPASAYGVTASIILLMLWVSYSCLILLMGAEFTKVVAEENDAKKARPIKLAVNKPKGK